MKNLFTRRIVCTKCRIDLLDKNDRCHRCQSSDITTRAQVFDADIKTILHQIIERSINDIMEYRQKIDNLQSDDTNDIPFQPLYQEFIRDLLHRSILSFVLHLDGVALSKSSKLNLWLLSCSIVELPPHLRYRRFNMPVLSVWIGYREPIINLWLKICTLRLKSLKLTGRSFSSELLQHIRLIPSEIKKIIINSPIM